MLGKRSKRVEDTLKVHLFHVGQGENILLELPNGEYGIIDFYYEGALSLREPPALTYLSYLKEKEKKPIIISFICISHPDHDHIKGIDIFLKWVKDKKITVRRFWSFAGRDFDELVACFREAYETCPKTHENYHQIYKVGNRLKAIRDFLKSWRGRPEYLQDIRPLAKIDDNTDIKLVAPLGSHIREYDKKAWVDFCRLILEGTKHINAPRNLMSSIIRIRFHNYKLLFGGDTGLDIWLDSIREIANLGLNDEYGISEADFIKASHHGSKNSSSTKLWNKILNTKACIGISAGRKYGHPHRETLAHISKAAEQLKADPTICSTNVCSNCLSDPSPEKNLVDWFSATKYPNQRKIRKALELSRSKYYKRERNEITAPEFVGYIFEFDANSDEIRVTKAVTASDFTKSNCIYGGRRKKKFPECAF